MRFFTINIKALDFGAFFKRYFMYLKSSFEYSQPFRRITLSYSVSSKELLEPKYFKIKRGNPLI